MMTKSVDATLAAIRPRIKSVHVSIGNVSTPTLMTGYIICIYLSLYTVVLQ